MRLLATLLAKDLRRMRRNPLPWLIHLAMPLLITALIGLAFGRGSGDEAGLGRIEFAVVDEDASPLMQMLRGALNQGQASERLAPVFLDRAAAMARLEADQISAVVVIPAHFSRDYLTGSAPVTLELVKNPARSIHPAVLEELLGALVTGLNALARNLQSEFPAWREVFDGGADHRRVAELIVRGGDKLQTWRRYLDPPLIGYAKEVKAAPATTGGTAAGFNLFGYVLAGLATMFLLFLASTGMADLHHELAARTFERYHTLQQRLAPFLVGKLVFVVVMLLGCGAIMLGGGGLLFGIRWQHPGVLVLLVTGYAVFAAGFMAVFAALIPDRRRADALTNIVAMAVGLAGGCAFPPQGLPDFLRHYITPGLPSYWLAEGIRQLEFGRGPFAWGWTLLGLLLLGAALLGLAAALFRRRFAAGLRA
jgi:ABC-type multidrug transport system permease subunit